jgi:opacity protein-like surface antigen
MQIRKALMMSAAAVAWTVSSTSANAADSYVSVFGGMSFLQKPHLKGTSHTHSTTYQYVSTQSIDTSFKTGFVIGGNWGIDWGTFRTEVEFALRQNHSDSHGHVTTSFKYGYVGQPGLYTISSKDTVEPLSLTMRAYSLMANAWYDFHDLGLPGGLTPYVGGGLGGANVQLSGTVNSAKLISTNEFVFAWQLGAGMSLPLTDSLKAFLDYRYFAANGAQLKLTPGFHGGDIKADFDSHTVLIGLRMNL